MGEAGLETISGGGTHSFRASFNSASGALTTCLALVQAQRKNSEHSDKVPKVKFTVLWGRKSADNSHSIMEDSKMEGGGRQGRPLWRGDV